MVWTVLLEKEGFMLEYKSTHLSDEDRYWWSFAMPSSNMLRAKSSCRENQPEESQLLHNDSDYFCLLVKYTELMLHQQTCKLFTIS